MRLLTYERAGAVRHGHLVDDDRVAELGDGDLSTVIGESTAERTPVGEHSLADVTLRAPLLRPPKVLAIAANYQDHVAEGGGEPIDKSRISPRLFLKPGTAITDPGAAIRLPDVTSQMDWEAELVVVLGRGGRNITVDSALDHVAGYTAGNDVSARSMDYGYERDTDDRAVWFFDWLAGKWLDGFAPLGPWIVTTDEVPDPQDLRIALDLNGTTRQDSSTKNMIFSIAEQIAFASRLVTLEAGDVIYTGTPAGVGAATGDYLQPGDEMTVRISGVGELTNRIQ